MQPNDDPFARLEHTHRRIEERLEDLDRGASSLGDPAEHARGLQMVEDVLGFFARAGARHHEDEDVSLFPRLREVNAVPDLVKALEEEHRAHAAALTELERAVAAGADGPRVRELAAALSALYRAHIVREERELFPAARAALDAQTVARMAREMAERRPGMGHNKR